jgi:hypothetical protein
MLVAQSPTFESLSHYVSYEKKREAIMEKSYEPYVRQDVLEARAKMMGMAVDDYRKYRHESMRPDREEKRKSELDALDREYGYTKDGGDDKIDAYTSVVSKYYKILKKIEDEAQSVKEQIKQPTIFDMDMSMIPQEKDGE